MKALCDNCKREYDCGQIDFIEDYEKNNELLCDDCRNDREE